MIIFLSGPDEYRRSEKRTAILEEFKRKHTALGLEVFEMDAPGEWDRFRDFAAQESMFAGARLAVLHNAFECTDARTRESIRAAIEKKDITVLISDAGPLAKDWAFLKAPSKRKSAGLLVQEFPYLEGGAWKRLIETEAAKRNVHLSAQALGDLEVRHRGDTWRLITELDKLRHLESAGIEPGLEGQGDGVLPDFWEQVGALRGARVGERLTMFERLLGAGEPPAKLFHLLAYQWPARIDQFARYDVLVKSGKIDYEEALLDLLIS